MKKPVKIVKDEHYIQLLEFALNQVSEAIYINDDDGIILFVNSEAEKSDGVIFDKTVGYKEADVFDTKSHITVFDSGVPILDEVVPYTTPDGKYKMALHNVYPYFHNGQISGTVSVSKDITQVDQYMMKIFQLQQQMQVKKKGDFKNGTSYTFEQIIGKSMAILKTINVAQKAAQYKANVLIIGETGTGKELISQSIHNASSNRDEPFVGLNCAAVPENLIESILFGTSKGAFTGAQETQGLFESAGNGTLFLDEIDSMSKGMQAKLLRALQEQKIRRIGSNKEIPIHCRVISATNADINKAIQNNDFRSDVYYRLASIIIEVPPLRNRTGDIEVLSKYFIEHFKEIYNTKIRSISSEALKIMSKYSWPGNVRQLEKMIERIVLLAEPNEKMIKPSHLSPEVFQGEMKIPTEKRHFDLNNLVDEYETMLIQTCLEENNNNLSATARHLNIHRNSLYKKLKRLNIQFDENNE